MTDSNRTRLLEELARMQVLIARLSQRVGQLETADAPFEARKFEARKFEATDLDRDIDIAPVQLSVEAIAALEGPMSPLSVPYPYPDCPKLRSVFAFIEANYHRSIRLNEVARTFGYSPSYLTHLVRRLSGKTIYQWIICRRMFQARYLLLHTDWTVYEIARAVGYADTGHFVKHFRQLHHRPPKAWRERQMRKPKSVT